MANLQIANALPPLAWGEDGEQFAPPDEAICWRLRRQTSGRPALVGLDESDSKLDLYADEAELRAKVGDLPGIYRLYPVDEDGQELYPVAKVTVLPRSGPRRHADTMILRSDDPNRMYQIVDRLLDLQERSTFMATEAFKTVATSFSGMQEGSATLLNSAATTIQVANGVEGLEREEPKDLDVEELAEKLGEALGEDDKKNGPHWAVQMLPMFMQFAKGFADSMIQQQSAGAAKAATPTQAAPGASAPAKTESTTTTKPNDDKHQNGEVHDEVNGDGDDDREPLHSDVDAHDEESARVVTAQGSLKLIEIELGPAGAGRSMPDDSHNSPMELGPAGAGNTIPGRESSNASIKTPQPNDNGTAENQDTGQCGDGETDHDNVVLKSGSHGVIALGPAQLRDGALPVSPGPQKPRPPQPRQRNKEDPSPDASDRGPPRSEPDSEVRARSP